MVTRRTPSPLGAAFRSLLVPGWGQVAINRNVIGRLLLFSSGFALLVGLTLFVVVEPIAIAARLTDPDVLLGIVLVNVGVLLIRLFATGHAWWAGGGKRLFAVATLGVLVAVPHIAVAWVGLQTRESLLKVFAAPATPTTSTTSTSTTTTLPPLDLTPVSTLPGQYAPDSIDMTRKIPWRPFGEERINILLLGGDAGPGRGGLRTDTIMVASLHPVTGEAALFGIPRNFGGITFSDGSTVPVRRLNHVYNWGVRHPEAFAGPDPGASAVLDVVSFMTGLDIDHYVLVDLTGFGDLVDVLGGVTLNVKDPIWGPLYDPHTGGYVMVEIPAGVQDLDGDHALAYARARYGTSDYSRMGRQRCILTSLVGQSDPIAMLARLPDLLGVIEENVVTDLPIDRLPDLVQLLLLISADDIRVIGFDATWSVGRTPDGHPIPDVEGIRGLIRGALEDADAATGLGVLTAGDACGLT